MAGMRVSLAFLGAVLMCLLGAARAHAEPKREVRAAAVALFDEARGLMAAGRYAEACPKLEESQRLDPGVGTLFNLSDCNEHIGRTASAWIGYREVASTSLATRQVERERVARARAAALEPKLTRLRILVAPNAAVPGLEVRRNGEPVGPPLWGTAVPLDPGQHVVRAAAPGRDPWATTVTLSGPGATLDVTVPLLAAAQGLDAPPPVPAAQLEPSVPPAPAPKSTAAPALPSAAERPRADEPATPRAWQRPLGMALAGLGVVGLAVGTGIGVSAKSTFGDAAGHCNDQGQCDGEGLSIRHDAVVRGNLATGVFVAGGVLAAGGVVLWLTAPPGRAHAPTAGLLAGPGSLTLRGAF